MPQFKWINKYFLCFSNVLLYIFRIFYFVFFECFVLLFSIFSMKNVTKPNYWGLFIFFYIPRQIQRQTYRQRIYAHIVSNIFKRKFESFFRWVFTSKLFITFCLSVICRFHLYRNITCLIIINEIELRRITGPPEKRCLSQCKQFIINIVLSIFIGIFEYSYQKEPP